MLACRDEPQRVEQKAQELQAKEHETETRLKADEETTKQQMGAVTSDVNGVKGKVAINAQECGQNAVA